jgi:eukaryotic-like serine/threonine-protein kinase
LSGPYGGNPVARAAWAVVSHMAVDTDILPERYRSPQRVGRGGMGDIYRATDEVLGRRVAVKVLADRYAHNEDVRRRFTREALAAARLSSDQSIVTIFDVGEHRGRPFIVMEYLGGGSLEDKLRDEGAQPPGRVLPWLEQTASALDAAHRRGIVHRDIKPANLLLDDAGNVHVADFGIASAADLDSLTMTGTVLGTAGYLAPEQANGERATPASDRYSLGVVAFELLIGRRPFERESATAEAAAHVHAAVPSVYEFCDDLPGHLDLVFRKALAKDPDDRYPTGADFVAALRDALAQAAGTTREIPVAPAAGRAPARRLPPAAVALVALLAAAGIGGAIAAILLTQGEESAAPQVRTRVVVRTSPTRTVTQSQTVTTTQQPPQTTVPLTPPSPPPAGGQTGAQLNDQGFALMRQGSYAGALPLLEQAVAKLRGSGDINEAYASYNLAYTRFQLGRCDGVPALLDRSEAVQGHRKEIDRLRKEARKACPAP